MSSLNRAAWIMAAKSRPLEIHAAPTGTPGPNQLLVRNHAIAINPIDVKLQETAMYQLDYPTIFGQDVAGEVAALGPNVARFKKGQRVLGNTYFPSKRVEDKGFQLYSIIQEDLASEIPADMSMVNAAVIPTGLTTAACALFQPDCLGLQLPPASLASPAVDELPVLLIWGGASSVGCSAIQLAVAAGYRVLTTASPRNFELVKRLGASYVVDYKSASAVSDLAEVVVASSHRVMGAVDASGRAVGCCVEFVEKCEGVKFVAATTGGFASPPPGVTIKHIYGPSILNSHVAKAIYQEFLPRALSDGRYAPAPEPLVVGTGLESIQKALDLHNRGISAQKLVVSLLI
ncbi:putative secondary metabolism biosynthetic enzyme [Gnomoniopsis sp. IMI 355080]|nr:putative secondary metabolism biosynthetic enzyme [Gnomoniopsis sp. IMI 355080]